MRNFSLELLNAFNISEPESKYVLGALQKFQTGDMFHLVMVRGNEMGSAKTKCADSFSLSFAD